VSLSFIGSFIGVASFFVRNFSLRHLAFLQLMEHKYRILENVEFFFIYYTSGANEITKEMQTVFNEYA
jgi:hypothetical protein